MTIPPISRGIGALTPDVWEKMAHAADAAAEVRGSPAGEAAGRLAELGGYWSLAGTFLARLSGYEEISEYRWAYDWTHAVPYVDNEPEYFNLDDQPDNPNSYNTYGGVVVEPFMGLAGSASSYTHIIPTDLNQAPTYPAAYNLAEWNNTATYANGVDIDAESFPDGLEIQPIFDDAAEEYYPLVVMHWTRYCYGGGDGDLRSRVLFFFDRQNHFDGDCS